MGRGGSGKSGLIYEDPMKSVEQELATHWQQYSCVENPIDRGTWWVPVHRVAMRWIQLRD